MNSKMALRRFALAAVGGYRGRDAGESFARDFIGCFGPPPASDARSSDSDTPSSDGAPVFCYSFPVVADGKRSQRTVSAYWPARRVVVDVVDRELTLDLAWAELLRACLQMDAEPQYVVLTNQRDVRLYDLARDRGESRLTIALDELPKYSEAFPFFEPGWVPGSTPKIINVDKVSKEVADLVAKVYRALVRQNPKRQDEVIRFTLQCIVAMFAEDIGLLPKEYFTTLLYRAGEEGGTEAKLTELFTWMSTPIEQRAKDSSAIPYFNGGLFTDAITLPLDATVLRALTKASEANWTYVDPHIFGSVFQGVMDDAERHASGAHYTAREDIMSVVGPTIVEPWRERIEAAKTLEDLKGILRDLTTYRVLDPACGSGNFLYVAFRELYRLETEVLARIYDEFPSATKGKGKISWVSGIRTTNFYGVDINPFAVELAKTTLNMAKKIAFEQRKEEVIAKFGQFTIEVDPSLPLENLDRNIHCLDALFTSWPKVDAIVGNPPFLGAKKFGDELGSDYVKRLRAAFPDVLSRADYCVHWFQRAHEQVVHGTRAGFVATNGVRSGETCESSLRFVLENGGVIVDAISQKAWSGDAGQAVSIVNWVRANDAGRPRLVVDGRVHFVAAIAPHLQLFGDASDARPLSYPSERVTEGIHFGTKTFVLNRRKAGAVATSGAATVLHAVTNGTDILSGQYRTGEEWTIYLPFEKLEEAAKAAPEAFSFMKRHAYPIVEKKASSKSYEAWRSGWWRPYRDRREFFTLMRSCNRMIACSQTMARPIFFFLSTAFRPANSVQLFGYEDDYSFGVIQSALHWAWARARGGGMKKSQDGVHLPARVRYRTAVWNTFPWPQEPSLLDVLGVARAAQALRATRDQLMGENGWSLRDLYRSAEVEGPHLLKDAQATLDAAVEAAFGKPADQEATEFLLEMNLALAEDEAGGRTIQGPGLPKVNGKDLDPKDPRWFSSDCIEPPPFPGADSAQADAGAKA